MLAFSYNRACRGYYGILHALLIIVNYLCIHRWHWASLMKQFHFALQDHGFIMLVSHWLSLRYFWKLGGMSYQSMFTNCTLTLFTERTLQLSFQFVSYQKYGSYVLLWTYLDALQRNSMNLWCTTKFFSLKQESILITCTSTVSSIYWNLLIDCSFLGLRSYSVCGRQKPSNLQINRYWPTCCLCYWPSALISPSGL